MGQKYAINTGALVLGLILQRFDVELADEGRREMHFKEQNLTLASTDGNLLRFKQLKRQ